MQDCNAVQCSSRSYKKLETVNDCQIRLRKIPTGAEGEWLNIHFSRLQATFTFHFQTTLDIVSQFIMHVFRKKCVEYYLWVHIKFHVWVHRKSVSCFCSNRWSHNVGYNNRVLRLLAIVLFEHDVSTRKLEKCRLLSKTPEVFLLLCCCWEHS